MLQLGAASSLLGVPAAVLTANTCPEWESVAQLEEILFPGSPHLPCLSLAELLLAGRGLAVASAFCLDPYHRSLLVALPSKLLQRSGLKGGGGKRGRTVGFCSQPELESWWYFPPHLTAPADGSAQVAAAETEQ